MRTNTRNLAVTGLAILGLLAATVPAAAADQAGPGEWDYKGSRDFNKANNQHWPYKTGYVGSGGGSLKVCVNSPETKDNTYALDEADPGADEGTIIKWTGAGCRVIDNLSKYVDGENNRAEFYVKTNAAHEVPVSVQYWD